MTTVVLLILHGLMAVLLIGGITHQAIAVFWRLRRQPASFVDRARTVKPFAYTNAIVALYLVTLTLGAIIYPPYTLGPRPEFKEEIQAAFGAFEIKEHFGAIGLAILPAYWYYWRLPATDDAGSGQQFRARDVHTTLLAVIVWFDFISGHVLNNLGGIS